MKHLHHLKKDQVVQYKSQRITNTIIKIQVLIDASISLLSQNKVMLQAHKYALNLNPIAANLVNNIKIFHHCEQAILAEISTTGEDPHVGQIHALLIKIKNYIDLNRVSKLQTFELKHFDAFQEEAWALLDELKELLKLAESH